MTLPQINRIRRRDGSPYLVFQRHVIGRRAVRRYAGHGTAQEQQQGRYVDQRVDFGLQHELGKRALFVDPLQPRERFVRGVLDVRGGHVRPDNVVVSAQQFHHQRFLQHRVLSGLLDEKHDAHPVRAAVQPSAQIGTQPAPLVHVRQFRVHHHQQLRVRRGLVVVGRQLVAAARFRPDRFHAGPRHVVKAALQHGSHHFCNVIIQSMSCITRRRVREP